MNIIVLAAGMGKRMHSALPKVLHRIAGRPLLGHVLDTARALRPRRLLVVYGHGGEAVRAAFAAQTDIEWVLQEPQLGTGHAARLALEGLDDSLPTLVLYGDVPLTRVASLERLIAAAGSGLALLTVRLADPTGYGRILRSGGTITGIVEEKDANPAERAIEEVNTGILVAPTAPLRRWLAALSNQNAQGEYYLTDVIAMAANSGQSIASIESEAVWETLGVNSKAQLALLERQYQSLVAQDLLARGVTLLDPARIDVRGELVCDRDVRIDVGSVFEGRVDLGEGVVIGPSCVIRDSVIGAHSTVAAFSHIVGARVGRACHIGPYARIRPETTLADEAHIGNFVEIKNSEFGLASKANHLSYVGDTTVGAKVNIGAGTITCNYDGANKHRTVIDDDVHIGSDTQLVAPVHIGAGATVGAGTTVWKDVAPGQLVTNPKTQQTRGDWKRPKKKAP